MDRASLDAAARELLGRPMTDDEATFVANACASMGLSGGDILIRLMIVYAAMMTFLSRTLEAVGESRSPSAWIARHRGLAIMLILSLVALVAGAFALGQASVAEGPQRDIAKILYWALSPEGERARQMANSGLLKVLEDCSIPGWRIDDGVCMPGPDPSTGTVRGIRTLNNP